MAKQYLDNDKRKKLQSLISNDVATQNISNSALPIQKVSNAKEIKMPKESRFFRTQNLDMNDKWYQKFLQNSKAFEDNNKDTSFGEKVLDTGATIGATVGDIGGNFFKVFSDAGDAIAENTMRGVAQIEDWIGGDENTNRWGLNDRANRWRKAINQFHNEGSIYEKGLNALQDYSISGDTTDKIAQGMGYTWATMMGSGILEEAGLASEITVGTKALNVKMPIVSMLHSFNTGMAEGFTDEDKKAWEVVLNSMGEAGIDGFTEGMFGMLGVGGSSIDDALKGKVSSLCKSGFLKALAQTGMSAVGEGTEELAGYLMEYAWHNGVMANLDKAINNVGESSYEQAFNSEEMWESFWTSAISSAFSNGISMVDNVAKTSNNIIQEEENRRGRPLTEEEKKEIREGTLYNQMYINEEEALGNLSRANKAAQAEKETAYLYNQMNQQSKEHMLLLSEEGNEIEQEEEISPAEQRMELRKEIQNSELTNAQKKQLINQVSEDSDLDEIKRTMLDVNRLNQIQKGTTTVENVINESEISNKQKQELLKSYTSEQTDATQTISLLSKYENQAENVEVEEKQDTTIENKPLLQAEQQITQEEPQTSENEISEELGSFYEKLEKSNISNEEKGAIAEDFERLREEGASLEEIRQNIQTYSDVIDGKIDVDVQEEKVETKPKAENKPKEILDTTQTYKNGRRQTYAKYAQDNSEYDRTSLDRAKEIIPANNQGRRTKEQWLNIAKQIGLEIADKTDKEVEKIAYRTWLDERPNDIKSSLNRQGKKFVGFNSDEWLNTIYNQVKETRRQNETIVEDMPQEVEEAQNGIKTAESPENKEILAKLAEETSKLFDETEPIEISQEEIEQENTRAKDLSLLLNANLEDDLGEMYSLKDKIGKSQGRMSKQQEKDHTTKILSKAPSQVKRAQRLWALTKASLIDKGAVFEDMDMRTGDLSTRSTQSAYQNVLNANKEAEYAIGNDRYIFSNGDKIKISDSLNSIMNEVGEDNRKDFDEYAYHLLNTDRMSLKEKAQERAKKIQTELDELIERNKRVPVEDFDKLRKQAEKKIAYLNEIENKEVFEKEGEVVTAEESLEKVRELEEKHPEFKDIIQKVYQYLDANNVIMKNNGMISQDTVDLFKELYPHYVPITRVGEFGEAIRIPLKANETTINNPIFRAKGGTEDLAPLFETIAERTRQTYKAAARNNLGQAIFQKLGAINEIKSTIDDNVSVEDLIDSAGDDSSIETLIQSTKDSAPKLAIFVNGKRVEFEINDDIYDALKAPSEKLQKFDNTKGAQLLQGVSKLRRGLLTEYNPLFLVTNGIKDAQDVLMNSQHPWRTYSKFREAYAQIAEKGYWYQEYMQNGGYNLSLYSDGEFNKKALDALNKKQNIPQKALSAIANANQTIELAPRLAEYIASREMGRDVQTSMLDSARVTTNFSAGGEITKFLNRNGFTFLNANVQGMAQQFRNVREASHKGIRGWANLAVRGLMAAAPLALLNGIIWKDDEEYNELSDYIKDNYYIIGKYGDDQFIRIPKGRIVSSIQKAVGDAYDFSSGNTDVNVENVIDAVLGDIQFTWDNIGVGNPAENNLLAPVGQVLSNNAWYGGDIVSSRLQNEDVENIYDESTDYVSRGVGQLLGSNKVTSELAKKFNINPITLNYLADQYSGAIGDLLLPMITPEVKTNAPNPLLAPTFDKFTTNSTMKNKASTEYYTLKDNLESASKKTNATDEDKVKYQFLNSFGKDMSELYTKKREIQNSDSENKYEQVKEVQDQINKLMYKNMEAVKKANVQGDTATIGDKMFYKNTKGQWNEVEEGKKPVGLSLQKYAQTKNDLSKLTEAKRKRENDENATLNGIEEAEYLLNSNYSKREKELIYSQMLNKKDSDYNYLKLLSSSMDIDNYLDYKTHEFKNEDDPNSNVVGKTISGSKEKSLKNYLNNSNFSNIEMTYLYGNSYKLSNQQMNMIQGYMDSLGLTEEEQKEIATKGLAASNTIKYEDGTWKWKKK